MRWQVRQSKVRSSKPRSPGEIRASPILCLQMIHIGRSTMDDIRIAQPPLKPIWVSAGVGLSGSRLSAKIWHDRQCAKELGRILRALVELGLHGLRP